jgi:hypothetical protein
MARAQVVPKKGRSSSSAKKRSARSRKSTQAGASRRPSTRTRSRRQSGMAGSKGKGRGRQQRDVEAADAREAQRRQARAARLPSGDAAPEAEASRPPTIVGPDATVAEQRRAASGQDEGARTNRPADAGDRRARGRRAGLGFRDDE